MKKVAIISAVLAVIVVGVRLGAGTPESATPPTKTQEASRTTQEASQTKQNVEILFFMNPNGMPCRMQDNVIRKAGGAIADAASVIRVKTTVSSDRAKFYEYGIRGLPSLVILKDGKVAHRFTPGIRSEKEILEALNKVRG